MIAKIVQKRRKHRKKGSLLPFIKFHRWAGLFSLLFLIWLSVTGIMLNHTEDLQMDKTYVSPGWLLSWYGISLPKQQVFINLDDNWIVKVGQHLYSNDTHLDDTSSAIIGAYQTEAFNVLVLEQAVYLLTFDGELIDKLDSDKGLPSPISQLIAIDSKEMHNISYVLKVKNTLYIADEEYINWMIFNTKSNMLQRPFSLQKPPLKIEKYYQQLYLSNKLSLEKLVQDIHSGRILGSIGVLFMDLVAIMLILLALSGVWVWGRRLRKKH